MVNINNKPWDKLRFRDIEKFLSEADDENFFFEFKSDDEEPKKLIKEISAFANTYGGYILLGVNDDKTIGGCKKWTEQRIHLPRQTAERRPLYLPAQPHFSPQALSAAGSPCTSPTT